MIVSRADAGLAVSRRKNGDYRACANFDRDCTHNTDGITVFAATSHAQTIMSQTFSQLCAKAWSTMPEDFAAGIALSIGAVGSASAMQARASPILPASLFRSSCRPLSRRTIVLIRCADTYLAAASQARLTFGARCGKLSHTNGVVVTINMHSISATRAEVVGCLDLFVADQSVAACKARQHFVSVISHRQPPRDGAVMQMNFG